MKLRTNEGYWHQNFSRRLRRTFKQATALFYFIWQRVHSGGRLLLGGRAGNSFGQLMVGWRQFCLYRIFFRSSMCFGVQAKFVNPVRRRSGIPFCRNAQHEDDDPACNLDDSVCLSNTTTLLRQFPDADLWNRSDGVISLECTISIRSPSISRRWKKAPQTKSRSVSGRTRSCSDENKHNEKELSQ